MKKSCYIVVRSDGVIELTEPGRSKAESVLSRHEVLTKACEKIGLALSWQRKTHVRSNTLLRKKAFDEIKNISICNVTIKCEYQPFGKRVYHSL